MDNKEQTLFVTLKCMQIKQKCFNHALVCFEKIEKNEERKRGVGYLSSHASCPQLHCWEFGIWNLFCGVVETTRVFIEKISTANIG